MSKLSRIERERQIELPHIYKDFYEQCFSYTPKNLVGTDFLNNYPDLYERAIELLEQNGVENFLDKDDFVFMMHQGYIFCYFKADGNPDPTVYLYAEQTQNIENLGPFSVFINTNS